MANKIKQSLLTGMEEDQINLVVSESTDLRARGHVDTFTDLYPDLADLGHSGFTRHDVPLELMLLLYERVVVYIPPKPPAELEQKFGMSLSQLTTLAQSGLVVPLLGHLADYSDGAFSELIELRPASVWARGLGVVEALGMHDTLDESKCPLPVAEIAQISHVRSRFARHFPDADPEELTAKVSREILTNYADLCVFGEVGVADALAAHQDPEKAAVALFAANEVRTYPNLFGLGGTANYDLPTIRLNIEMSSSFFEDAELLGRTRVIPASLKLLLEGVGLPVGKLETNDIIAFHQSGDAARLRRVVEQFEVAAGKQVGIASDDDLDVFLTRAEQVQSLLQEAAQGLLDRRNIERADAAVSTADSVLKAGGIALGGWLGSRLGGAGGAVVGGLSGNELLQLILPPQARERLITASLVARFGPRGANLWQIRRHNKS